MSKLKVGIMDKGWYTTVEINPNDKNEINRVVEEYLEEIRKKIYIDLLVTYEESHNYYTHKNFTLKDFDEAVEFLKSKEETPKEGD